MGTFFFPARREDPRRCRVCGNLTLTPARRVVQWVFLALVGALLMYIVLDVAENGRVDASLYTYVRQQWQSRHAAGR